MHDVTVPTRARLQSLESEAVRVLRETAASFSRPVLMYSIGKDSTALLHLARKAFVPQRIPFPLLHIDTGWKFREMIAFRDRVAGEADIEMLVHQHPDRLSPFDHESSHYTRVMKTEALLQILNERSFDAAIGGARRDEERSRRKERIFSHRSPEHAWDPRGQRPEVGYCFNTRLNPGESMRVFPLSNWTELDVWEYIRREALDVVPLYFSQPRPVVERHGQLIPVDDDRFVFAHGEEPRIENVRFRTLGCYPLTAGDRSAAASLDDIVAELRSTTSSERSGRLIDHDETAAMERKKRAGYF